MKTFLSLNLLLKKNKLYWSFLLIVTLLLSSNSQAEPGNNHGSYSGHNNKTNQIIVKYRDSETVWPLLPNQANARAHQLSQRAGSPLEHFQTLLMACVGQRA